MPELPEVETVMRGLTPVMEGQVITKARAMRPDLRFPLPDGFGQILTGRRIEGLSRRAKYMLITLDGGWTLLSHLGMSGRFRVHRPGAEEGALPPLDKHDHVVFDFDHAQVRYNDPRRFGFMDLFETASMASHPMLADLGPEPLSDAFNPDQLRAAMAGKTGPIKSVLLDQRVVAGLGNIYVCEALYRSGINPKTKAGRLSKARVTALVEASKAVLEKAIKAGGSTLRDHRQPDGELGYFQHAFQVYGREGETCAQSGCSASVSRITQSGRSTFYCPQCQR